MNAFPWPLFISCILFLTNYWKSHAQTENFGFERLTIEQGLSEDYIMCMMEDRKGHLWFGTGNGLDKYDGYRFRHYRFDPADTSSLPKNQVISLWEDSGGIIWVGTTESTCRFDPLTEKFTRLERNPGNPHAFKFAQSFNEDTEGNLWVGGSFSGELRQIDRKTGRFSAVDYADMLKPDVDSGEEAVFSLVILAKDRAGTLWVGSTYGLHRLNLTPRGADEPADVSFTHYRHDPNDPGSLSHNGVTDIFEDSKGVLWVVTLAGGLNAFDRKTGTFTRFLPVSGKPLEIAGEVRSGITEDAAGNLWVGSSHGLYRADPERKTFFPFLHDPGDIRSISADNIYAVLRDKAGILWVATPEGVNKLDPHRKPFRLFRHEPLNPGSLSYNRISAICEDREGVVWVGTAGGGLNALDKGTGAFTRYRHNPKDAGTLRNDVVSALLEDRDGNLWIGNGEVLSRFDSKREKLTHYHLDYSFPAVGDYPILDLFEDRQGIIWIGTIRGMFRFDRSTGVTLHYPYEPGKAGGIGDYWALSIFEDSKGNLWIGHGSQALSRFDRATGKFTQYRHDSRRPGSISSNTVSDIYEDTKGNLWFGTSEGGLCLFDNASGTFTAFTVRHGLAGNSVYSILEDQGGDLWLGTNNGLSRFSPTAQTFTNYGVEDGLQSKLFTSQYIMGGAAFKGRDGTLYFGGANGMNAFNPAEIHPNTYVPPVAITQFYLFDRPVPGRQEAKEIALRHDQNFFSIEFAALNYTSPSNNRYAYQLEGVDRQWVQSGTRRLASYTDIAPGTYTFRVRGSNNDGVWNMQGTAVGITIFPPWWRTWWAYAFYSLCLVAVVLAVDRSQRRRLIQKEREKAQERELAQAREIERAYHELKQTQAQLVQKEKMASLGELTAGIAHEIQNPLNFVNNFSELGQELCQEVQEEVKQLRVPFEEKRNLQELASDLSQNQKKVLLHGQRADAIVKGMLEHSRTSAGERQLTNLNALVDEYFRLSYSGFRAKHKDFSCTLETAYGQSLEKIEVVPQELGRVLLNLFNNAFYAVQQKDKLVLVGYEPKVAVSTSILNSKVEVRVWDNGTGVPESVKGKIFQPFFTTKPTGQGTGLGLSLSYDIITKGHGGELRMATAPEEWTEFTITLPYVPVAEEPTQHKAH
ncbi:two-component regulator propeller domain-containing protein [Pontibacter toksunensis]|uniref:histidine kinase n=1 Tax=Pontibacter toksunensis TaxID=1332631 RepID=A0ABW6C1N3_9BACT